MRLATRIGRLEAKMPLPPVGCDLCRHRFLFFEGMYTEGEQDGVRVVRCSSCGVAIRRSITIIENIRLEEIV